ncbi:unnamed protein product [Ectocarpus sp. 8 AP-2014]
MEHGTGDPIVLLHGVPTSSYLWRNIMPAFEGKGRLVAPDFIGMGDSEKIDNSGPKSYTIPEHASYLFALLEALGVTEKVTLVIHHWGSGLGFHWAETHRDAVKGIAFMEGIVTTFPTWDHFNKELPGPIKQLRGPEGEKMALEDNFFIENLLPGAILSDLSGRRARSLPQAFPRGRRSAQARLAHFPSKDTLPTLWLSLRLMVPGLPHPRSPSSS